MNSSNRAANRTLVFVLGLLLLVIGVAAAAAVLVQPVRDAWQNAIDPTSNWVSGWLQQTPLGDTGVSWLMPAVLVLLVLAVVVLIAFATRHGRGHIRIAVTEVASAHGTTVVESGVAEQALQDVLSARPEFVASHVSLYRVKRTPVLKISVTCRRGFAPNDAAALVEGALHSLDALLGRELPAFIQIGGGFRARLTSTTRLQ